MEYEPISTWDVGHRGAKIEMGLYKISAKDDNDPQKIVSRGFTICPVKSADNCMKGIYDSPEQSRVGFLKDGDGKAVLDGTGKPDDLTEEQRDTARAFLSKVTEKLDLHPLPVEHKLLRQSPNKPGEITPWDLEQSVEMHLTMDGADNQVMAVAGKKLGVLLSKAVTFYNMATVSGGHWEKPEPGIIKQMPFHKEIIKRPARNTEAVKREFDTAVWLMKLEETLAAHIGSEVLRQEIYSSMEQLTKVERPGGKRADDSVALLYDLEKEMKSHEIDQTVRDAVQKEMIRFSQTRKTPDRQG